MMQCTECNEPIPFNEEDITVYVVYGDKRGTESHCHHHPFDASDKAILGIFGSRFCLTRWKDRHADRFVSSFN